MKLHGRRKMKTSGKNQIVPATVQAIGACIRLQGLFNCDLKKECGYEKCIFGESADVEESL